MLLSGLVEKYLKYTVLRPHSARQYILVMRLFISVVGDKELSGVTVDDLIQFREAILGRAKPITFNNYRQHLVVMFNFAISNEWLRFSPFVKIKPVHIHRKPKKTVEVPLIEKALLLLESEEKLEALGGAGGRFHPQWFWRLVVKTFFFTGMRLRQLVELQWQDINMEQGKITLRAEGSKSYREWNIPLPVVIRDELLILMQRSKEMYKGRDFHEQQVFNLTLFSKFKTQFVRNVMIEENVHAFFKRISKALEEPISPHRLRHTTATILVRMNKDLKNIQGLLGHTTIKTTLEYVENNIESMRDMVDGLTIDRKATIKPTD
jgi:integrase